MSVLVNAELRRPACVVSCAIHVNVLGGPSVIAIVHALSENCVFGVPVATLPFTRNAGECRALAHPVHAWCVWS